MSEIPRPNQIFYFFLELYAIIRAMPVVHMELTIPVLSLLEGFDLIWDGHLRNFSCRTSRKSCDTVVVKGVNRRGE